MSANFNPELGSYKTLQPFRYWCQKVLPLVYDDSLSYYELLCKTVDYLNKTMEDVETLHGDVTSIYNAYIQLQEYVNNYFSSLDVQEEINNKLNTMASDGSLTELLNPIILGTLPPYFVDSVNDMTDINRTYILKSNSHIYQHNNTGWTDTGIAYGETIGNVVTYLGTSASSVNIDDIEPQTVYIISNINAPGIPEKSSGFIYTYGDTNESRQQFYTVFSSGNTYYRSRNVNKKWTNWAFSALTYCGQLSSGSDLNNVQKQSIYLVSYEGASNMPVIDSGFVYTIGDTSGAAEQFYIRFSDGRTWYRRHVGDRWGSWNSNGIRYDGILSSGSDLNNMPIQSIYLVSYEGASNMPVIDSGFVYTFGENSGATEQLYIRFSDGRTWFRNRNASGTWTAWASNGVRYDGTLARGTDFNTVTEQSIYLCVAPIEYPNIPTNESGFLYTLGSTTNAMQLYIEFTFGKVYYRRRNYQGNWGKWIAKPDIGNSFAHMYSIGNSILTGSVWLNGVYDHLSEYGNAPYSVVADAISIPKENVTHKLVSGTGLVYNAGEGSFLDNIKQVDLSNYDVLLTHFYTEDMGQGFNIGSINSSAGDGTLAGAVMELLNYIKTSNSMCQLILVSVVPVSSTIYGNAVFTGIYPNGSSIEQLDNVMKEMASKYHFTYIDWQDLNISYNYHDYTDGLNVHANNENTYRVMGAYLGGRTSAKINF